MYEWESIDFTDAGFLVELRDPRQFGWGYFTNYSSASSEVGAFSWFESLDELLDYLVNIEPKIWSDGIYGLDESKYQELKVAVQDVPKEAYSNKRLTDGMREEISNQLEGGEISWWGEFSDLCTGNGPFSRQLIDLYFKEEDDENLKNGYAGVVTEEHVPGFIEFCKGFGH